MVIILTWRQRNVFEPIVLPLTTVGPAGRFLYRLAQSLRDGERLRQDTQEVHGASIRAQHRAGSHATRRRTLPRENVRHNFSQICPCVYDKLCLALQNRYRQSTTSASPSKRWRDAMACREFSFDCARPAAHGGSGRSIIRISTPSLGDEGDWTSISFHFSGRLPALILSRQRSPHRHLAPMAAQKNQVLQLFLYILVYQNQMDFGARRETSLGYVFRLLLFSQAL